jgi:metal-sulfur cluster biosynthetic enzyme
MTDDTRITPPVADKPQEKPNENAAVTGSSALPEDELDKLTDDIVAALKTVYDPEIPADIYELGLIYKIDIGDDRPTARQRRICPFRSRMRSLVYRA